MNRKLTVIAHIHAKAGQEAKVQEALLNLIAPTRAEAGCINYACMCRITIRGNLCFTRIG